VRLSIVVVSYNVKVYLAQQLASAKHALMHWGGEHEIWVIDNASTDGTPTYIHAVHPDVRLVTNAQNVGFSRANNQALEVILTEGKSDAVLLLNPDTVVATDAIARLVACMEQRPDVGAVGPRLISSSGAFMPESRRALPTPLVAFYRLFGLSRLFPHIAAFTQYHVAHLPETADHAVAVLSGSCMLLRAETLRKTGILDERFFMYGEDVDLSQRVTQAGYKNYYCAGAQVLHYKGRSSANGGGLRAFVSRFHFYQAMWIFARKHLPASRQRILLPWVGLGVAVRASLEALAQVLRSLGLPALEALQAAAIFLTIKTAWQGAYAYARGGQYPALFTWLAVPLYTLLFVGAFAVAGAYKTPYRKRSLLRGTALAFVSIATVSYLLPAINFSRFIVFSSVTTMAGLALVNRLVHARIKTGSWGAPKRQKPRTVIVGGGEVDGAELLRVAHLMHTQAEVLGIVAEQPLAQTEYLWLGVPAQLAELAHTLHLKQVVWCGSYDAGALLGALQNLGSSIHFYTVPSGANHLIGTTGLTQLKARG